MPLIQKGMSMLGNRVPKVINPTVHAIIDYGVAATFFTVGAIFWRRHKRAAISSLVCGAAVTATSLMTNYPGGVWKEISYETHGQIDMGLAGLTATMPGLMGFADDREAKFFQIQGIAETGVTVMTDFHAMDRTDYYRRSKAA